jgi:tetratricopeptide (TPR) repeat protein
VSQRVADRAVLAALLLFVAGRCLVPMDETDLFFNLRLGEIVLGSHTVPRTNLLSFTFPDARDVNLAWIFQIVLALAHRAGGIAGTVVLKTAFVLGAFALLFAAARRRGAHPAAAGAALALAAWAAEPRFVERPHLVTFLGLAFLVLALERAEQGRPRALHALGPLAVVWANANSCFFLAPVLLGLYAAGARLDGRRDDASRAALLAALLAPFVLATPSGVHALGYIANHWRMPSLRPLQEYRTASWPLDGPFFFELAGLALAAALPTRRFRQLVPAAFLVFVGGFRIRFVAELSLWTGPILAVALTEVAGRFAPGFARRAPILGRHATVAVAAGLCGLALVPRFATARQGGRFIDVGLEPGLVPEAAIRFIDQNGLRDRLYNDLEVGSYLTWQGWPRARVFQDPRINGYPASFHAVLKRDDLSPGEWEALLGRFGVTAALVTYPTVNPRAALFAPVKWALVYRDAEALVFVRRGAASSALVTPTEIPLTFEYSRDAGVSPRPLEAPPLGSPVPAAAWKERLGHVEVELGDDRRARDAFEAAWLRREELDPTARRALLRALGDVSMRLGDPARAAVAYGELADVDPSAHDLCGFALLAAGQAAQALSQFDAAIRALPGEAEAQLGRGLALARLGRDDEALATLRTFLATAPDHLGAERARQEIARLSRAK